MSNRIRWLHEQIRTWTSQGVISPAQADAIRRLHPEPESASQWGMIVFSGIGAVVLGLGVILLFAYNWQAIPKFGKLGLVFGALVVAHGSGLRLLGETDWRRRLGEALGVLGTMFFGAGIWLVAQVYHIDEHYPNAFLLWALGALALAWAVPSVAQGMIATALLCIWSCTERFGFSAPAHWAPLLLLAGIGSLAWRERSQLLLGTVLAALYLVLLTNAESGRDGLALPLALNVSVLLLGCGVGARPAGGFPAAAAVLRFFGWTGFLVVTYILTFAHSAENAWSWHRTLVDGRDWLPLACYGWLPFALMLAQWGWLALGARRSEGTMDIGLEQWLLPLTAVLSQVLAVAGLSVGPDCAWLVAGAFNLVFLAVAARWMARGCREGTMRPTILGSLLLVALVAARYFDLFENLATRGVVFLVVGGILFAEGFFYRRARQGTGDQIAPTP
jgi:uncharacterized membrane protein